MHLFRTMCVLWFIYRTYRCKNVSVLIYIQRSWFIMSLAIRDPSRDDISHAVHSVWSTHTPALHDAMPFWYTDWSEAVIRILPLLFIWQFKSSLMETHLQGILLKGSYLPCVSMAGRALLAGYHWHHSAIFNCIWAITYSCCSRNVMMPIWRWLVMS